VNRGTTGAIVGRQPFGGWKRSSVGPGTKAGGPNYLIGLGSWSPDGVASAPAATLAGPVNRIVKAADDPFVTAGARSDEQTWRDGFGIARELQGLYAERNLLRYRPVPVTVRVEADAAERDVLRVLAAGARSGAALTVSAATPLPARVQALLDGLHIPATVEESPPLTGRVRLIGGSASALLLAAGGNPDLAVWGDPVTTAGRLELLPFLHEQSISITAHRFGTPNHLTDTIV
jgi:RHH-type proline utilization regulon transcriptional repressor/proline dehydrogenase/delta 1-pyrroline-5-carboxylate dehydrogenase